MKKLKSILFIISIVLIGTSCSSSDNELDPFYEYGTPESLTTFRAKIEADGGFQTNGAGAQIVDYRSAEDFAQNHIIGAVNIPANYSNASGTNSDFFVQVKAQFVLTRPIFLYGGGNNTLVKLVAGNASKLGFGKERTHILGGTEFSMWYATYPELTIEGVTAE